MKKGNARTYCYDIYIHIVQRWSSCRIFGYLSHPARLSIDLHVLYIGLYKLILRYHRSHCTWPGRPLDRYLVVLLLLFLSLLWKKTSLITLEYSTVLHTCKLSACLHILLPVHVSICMYVCLRPSSAFRPRVVGPTAKIESLLCRRRIAMQWQ